MHAAAAQDASRPRDRRLALRRTRGALDRRLSSSAACRVPGVISFRGEGSSCYFVISCTARGSIDEIVCPCAAFLGLGNFMPFLTWSFETAAVGAAACPCYLVKTAKTRAQTNEIVWMRGRRRASCCVRGLVVDGASAEACLYAKNSSHSIVSKKNRYRTLKRRLFV